MQKLPEEVFISILRVKRIYYGYILNRHFKKINEEIKNNVISAKGDIFKIFISMYDCVDSNLIKNENMEFYRNIFENLKTSDDSKLLKKIIEEKKNMDQQDGERQEL